jgi:hypothetical protein
MLLIAITQGTLTSPSFTVEVHNSALCRRWCGSNSCIQIPGCTNPARTQDSFESVIVTISTSSASADTPIAYGAKFTFPRIVIGELHFNSNFSRHLMNSPGITSAAVTAPVSTTSSLTSLNFTVTVDASFSVLKVAVSNSFILPAASGALDCVGEFFS